MSLNEFLDPGLRIHFCMGVTVQAWNFANLSAPYWRFYYNPSPGAWITLHGDRLALRPAHYALIPPNTPFASGHSRPFEHLYLHFTAQRPYQRLKPEIFAFPADAATRERLLQLYRLSEGEGLAQVRGIFLAQSLICQALAQVPQDRLDSTPWDPRIATLIKSAMQSLGAMADNQALAKKTGMSENAFIRLFTSQTGQSPQAYFTEKRVDRACDLLRHSRASIEAIAEATGFCDRYHFSRVFKKIRKIPPATFRARAY